MKNKLQPNNNDVADALVEAAALLQQWASSPEIRTLLKGDGAIDLVSPRGLILTRLFNAGPARVTELATWLEVDKSTVTPQAAALEELGYISRRADPNDRRAHQLVVTPAGEKALTSAVTKARDVFSTLLASWTDDELDAFGRSLSKLNKEFEQSEQHDTSMSR